MLKFKSHETNTILVHWSNSFTQWTLITVEAKHIMFVTLQLILLKY